MKELAKYLIFAFLFIGCRPDKVTTNDVIRNFKISDKKPYADGQSIIDLSVELDRKADADKRNIIFKCSNGNFIPGNDTTSIVTAKFEDGRLVAKTKFKVSSNVGSTIFTVQPEIRSEHGDYLLTDSLVKIVSLPLSLEINPSSYAVFKEYRSEVHLKCTLKNGNRNVSSGLKVKFEGNLMNGNPANGKFRELQEISDGNSSVAAFYSVGNIEAGTKVQVKCTYLIDGQFESTIKDSCVIYVNDVK